MRRTVFVLMILFFSTLTGVISSNINTELSDNITIEKTSSPHLQNTINTFNTTYNSKLIATQIEISWDDYIYSKTSDSQPTVLDFIQLNDNSYYFLACPSHSGQILDNSTFNSDDSILLHVNQNLSYIKSKIIDGGGCTSNRQTGMTNIILSPDGQSLHLLGIYYTVNTARTLLNESITIPSTNGGGKDHFVAISLNRNNFSVENFKVITPSLTYQYSSCGLTIYEETHVSNNGFGFIVQLDSHHNSWGNQRCNSYAFGNTTITTMVTGGVGTSTENFILYANHSLDFYQSERISGGFNPNNGGGDDLNSINPPQLLSNGGWVLSSNNIQYNNQNKSITGTLTSCQENNVKRVLPDNTGGFHYLCGTNNQTTDRIDISLYYYNIYSSVSQEINLGVGEIESKGMIMPASDRIILSLTSSQTGLLIDNTSIYFGDFTLEINTTSQSIIRADTSFTLDYSVGSSSAMRSNQIIETRPVFSKSQSVIIQESGKVKFDNLIILELDSDSDSFSDRLDAFPTQRTQHSDTDNDGFGDNPSGVNGDDCIYQAGNSTIDLLGCLDTDGDGYSDANDKFINEPSQVFDKDGDGYGDNQSGRFGDACPQEYGESTRDSYGCPDSDFDGWSDNFDLFDNESSQWSDLDGDGYGDELNGFQGDACPKNAGSSTLDIFGCRDTDNDGWSDNGDALPENPTQWLDRDGDGYGDNDTEEATEIDYFPSDGTQWNDTDGDGHGDNPYGTQGDWFPSDPTRWMDSDRDGVSDDDDLFDNDATQWDDRDGDGYGDETNGNRPDAFPDDPLEWKDTDDDGIGDNSDDLPFNPSQTNDRDGDGFGDDIRGTGADPFPDDPTQWLDADGDGYGDNIVGNEPDLFPRDITQWFDIDGDGYGDNPNGVNPDDFPDDSTQWADDDGDGFGDNPNGTNPDPSINDYDNDGYLDNDDPFPQTSSPGDKDNDGVLDEDDAFPSNFREFSDNDADGIGDIEDLDDDNDGYLDEDELRSGSDSLDANSMPVEGFEIIIPGTSISLGAWDLIGIFGGVPLFGWIGFGFVTRNKRCARYEDLLNSANTRDELEKVALRWEYSLMLRMLGPHQGIRLERLRAELDDKFENATYDETEIGYDQTNIVENESKDIPAINESSTFPAKDTPATSTDESGYEWFKQEDGNWYRPAGSNDDWLRFEN